MPGNYVNEEDKVIYPKWSFMVEAMYWAKQYPESYTVYSAGFVQYADEQALTMFLMKWSD